MYLPLLHSYILYKIIHVSLTHRVFNLWFDCMDTENYKKKQVFALTNRGIVYTA